MISFVYFDVGGTVVKDLNGANKIEHEQEVCCNKYPIEPSLVSETVGRFEKNESLWPIIFEIKRNYRVGLLTNMYPGMLEEIKQRGLLPEISWDVIIDSSIVGVAKPNKEIYEIAQRKAGIPAIEILLIDNLQENVDGAKNAGWQAFRYTSSEELKIYFSQIDLF